MALLTCIHHSPVQVLAVAWSLFAQPQMYQVIQVHLACSTSTAASGWWISANPWGQEEVIPVFRRSDFYSSFFAEHTDSSLYLHSFEVKLVPETCLWADHSLSRSLSLSLSVSLSGFTIIWRPVGTFYSLIWSCWCQQEFKLHSVPAKVWRGLFQHGQWLWESRLSVLLHLQAERLILVGSKLYRINVANATEVNMGGYHLVPDHRQD